MKRFLPFFAALCLLGCICPSAPIHEPVAQPTHANTVYDAFYAQPSPVEKPVSLAYDAAIYRTNGYQNGARFPQTHVLRSRAALEEYRNGDGAIFDFSGAINQALDVFDDTFFSTHELVFVVLESGSGSVRYEVLDVISDEDGLTVALRSNAPEVGTSDMAEWHVILTLPAGTVSQDDPIRVVFPDPA